MIKRFVVAVVSGGGGGVVYKWNPFKLRIYMRDRQTEATTKPAGRPAVYQANTGNEEGRTNDIRSNKNYSAATMASAAAAAAAASVSKANS